MDSTRKMHELWIAGKIAIGTVLWSSGTQFCIVTGAGKSQVVDNNREKQELLNELRSIEETSPQR